MSKKIKRLKGPSPVNTKLFKPPALLDYDTYKPAFSFRDIRYGQKGCLSKFDKESKSSFIDKLLQISQLTWREIHSQPKKKYGYEPIPRKQFKVPLPPSITPEVSDLLVFQFSKAGRMAGYRKNDIFNIVVVGAHHELY